MGGVSLSKESCRFVKEERSLYFQMTTASSCCEGVARNQTAPRPIKYQLLVGPLRLGGALSLSSYQPPVCNRHLASYNSVE